ncbi:MAG: serine/threonine protein kinase [Deltaproteobacteria bacterium]|nr:serine/threonine protein kinase [Deltaproteobacteria bacterium]
MPCPDETEIAEFVSRALAVGAAAQIESHIGDCDDCRNLVFALASSGTDPGAAMEIERVGRFEVIGVIGQGAMGIVYRARDPELDRLVAVKIRRGAHLLDVEGEDRLRREAQALARLTHPNVVAVYETGRHDRSAYVAMEYVDGVTLDAWLSTPRKQRTILELFAAAGRGLAAAHAVGLVHRDFKPHNVFVSAAGTPKVGDFGLVRVERSGGDVSTDARGSELAMTLSLAGSLIGTPAYMAPEQLRGETATEASDQFSFCVTLYEALYGARPFTGGSLEELHAAMHAELVIPSSPRVPASIRRVLERGLHADPRRRFPSMPSLLGKLTKRSSVAGWIAAGVALGAIATVGATTLTASKTDPCSVADERARLVFGAERTQAIRSAFDATKARNAGATALTVGRLISAYGTRWETASTASCRATSQGKQSEVVGDRQRACLQRRLDQLDQLGGVLARVTEPAAVERAAAAVQGLPDADACTRIDATLGDREPPPADKLATIRELESRVERISGLQKTGQFVAAGKEIDPLVLQIRGVGYSPLLARALIVQAHVYSAISRFDQLEAILDEAAREAAKARDDELAAEAWTRRVYAVGVHFARYDDAHQWAAAAEAAVLRAGNPPELRATLHMNVGTLWLERGELDKARIEIEAALALRQRARPDAVLPIADAHNNLAATLQRQGKMDGARENFEKALAIYRGVHGDEHPDVADTYTNLGFLFVETDRPREAVEQLEKARDLNVKLLGPDHVNVGITLDTMGLAKVSLGEYQAAAELHRQAHAILLAKLGDKHPRVGYAMGNTARASLRLGDYAAAIKAYRESITLLSTALGPKHDLVARVQNGLAIALQFSGDDKAAETAFTGSLAIFEANQGPEGEETLTTRVNLAQLALARGASAVARPNFELAARGLTKTLGANHHSTLTALAGVVYCDAVERTIDPARVGQLETAFGAAKVADIEPHELAFIHYARARAAAGGRDHAKAKELGALASAAYGEAKLERQKRDVAQWSKGLN